METIYELAGILGIPFDTAFELVNGIDIDGDRITINNRTFYINLKDKVIGEVLDETAKDGLKAQQYVIDEFDMEKIDELHTTEL